MSVAEVPLAQIERNPKQPRQDFPAEHIERLAASIAERGLIQPITIRRIAPKRFQIVAGECRYRAHQLLGRDKIRAQIVDVDEREMLLRAIVENLQRRDMNPIEEARAYRTLLDQGYSAAQIVSELGLKSGAVVSQRLTLLDLTPEIQKLVASGNLPVTMAWGVAQVQQDRQAALVRNINAGRYKTSEEVKAAGIAIREADSQLDAFAAIPKASKEDVAKLRALEEKIEAIVSMVQLGFKDGECVAAKRVSPDRVKIMCDKLVLIRKHILQMEHDLRCAMAQTEILSELDRSRSYL